MRNILTTLLATCLLGMASSASAVTVNLGTVAAGDLLGGSMMFGTGTVIDDSWTFEITSGLVAAISVDANDLQPFFEISNFLVSSATPGLDFIHNSADNAFQFSGPLAAGSYTIDINGTAAGALGGQYGVLVGASVPLPPAMLLLGSALIGLLTVRRRKTATA